MCGNVSKKAVVLSMVTVPTYNKEIQGASCCENKVPFACFSLKQGVTWQCFDSDENPSCASTEIPGSEEEDATDTYDGACVNMASRKYKSAKNASRLVRSVRKKRTTVTTTTTTTTITTTTTTTSTTKSTTTSTTETTTTTTST